MNDNLEDVLGDPHGVTKNLLGRIADLSDATCRRSAGGDVNFTLELQPWHALRGSNPEFPVERVLIRVQTDGAIGATPLDGKQRKWLHRNVCIGKHTDLCLFYEQDPEGIRWSWNDGLVCYVGIVHRHLVFEEWVRRGHPWPCEDAPHGHGDHPIRTPRLQVAAGLPVDLSVGAHPRAVQ